MTYTSQKAFFQEKPKGEKGNSLIVIYCTGTTIPETPEYSTGAIPAGWSTDFPSSVEQNKWVYMSQRMSNETNWSTPIQISAHDGGPGADGSDIEYIYYRSENPVVSWDGKGPNLEEGAYNFKYTTDLKNGWSDSPQGVREDYKYEYVSVATKPAGMGTTWSDFSSPVIWSKWGEKGQNGDGVVYKYCLMTTQTTPIYPTPNGKNYTWTDNPSGVSESYPYEYVVAYSTSVVVINAKKIKTTQRSFPFEGEGSWKQYGTVGHEEDWTIRNGGDVSMDLDNSHIAIGDYAFVEGVINNSQDPNGQNGTPVKLYGKVIGLKNSSQNEGSIRMETKYLQIGAEPASQVALWAVWSKIQNFSISASSYFLVKENMGSSGYKNSVTLTAKPMNITGTYQWYKNNDLLNNETGQSYTVSEPGTYKCILTETGPNTRKIWEDEIGIVETTDGAEGKDAIAITLSNSNMIFHENQTAEETETCEVLVMEGTTSLTPQISYTDELPSGVVVQSPKITVSKQSVNGSFTFTVSVDVKGETVPITKDFTIYWKYVRDGIDGTSSLNLASDEYIDKYGDGVTLGRNYPYYTITANDNTFGALEICRIGKNFFETNKTYTVSYKIQGIDGSTLGYVSGYIGNFQFIKGTVDGKTVENLGTYNEYKMALPESATGIYQISIQLKCIDADNSRPGVYIQPLRNSATPSSKSIFKVWDIIVTEGAKEIAWAPANVDLEKWVNTFDLTAKSLAIYNKNLDQMNGVSWDDIILLAGKTIENGEVKDANAVYLAGWNVTSNALWYDGTVNDGQGSFDNIGKQNTFGIYPKGLEASELKGGFKYSITSDAWVLTAGDSFGITKKGAMYAGAGKIGGWVIQQDNLINTLYPATIYRTNNAIVGGSNGIDGIKWKCADKYYYSPYKGNSLNAPVITITIGDVISIKLYDSIKGKYIDTTIQKYTNQSFTNEVNLEEYGKQPLCGLYSSAEKALIFAGAKTYDGTDAETFLDSSGKFQAKNADINRLSSTYAHIEKLDFSQLSDNVLKIGSMNDFWGVTEYSRYGMHRYYRDGPEQVSSDWPILELQQVTDGTTYRTTATVSVSSKGLIDPTITITITLSRKLYRKEYIDVYIKSFETVKPVTLELMNTGTTFIFNRKFNSELGFLYFDVYSYKFGFDRECETTKKTIVQYSDFSKLSLVSGYSLIPNNSFLYLGIDKKRWAHAYINTLHYEKTEPTSDERLKNHITPISNEYDNIFDQLQAISYEWNDEKGFSHFGLSAQHTRQLLVNNSIPINEFGGYWEDEDTSEPGTMGIRYTELVPLCIAQIQKLKKRVKELEEKLTSS